MESLLADAQALIRAGDPESLIRLRELLTDPASTRRDRPWAPHRWDPELQPGIRPIWAAVVPLIEELAANPSADARLAGAMLAQYAPASALVPTLRRLTEDREPAVVAAAASALYEAADTASAPQLRALLLSPVPQVRVSAAAALGRLGGPADVPSLALVLSSDPAPQAQAWAAVSLSEIADPNADNALIQALDRSKLEPIAWLGVRRGLIDRLSALRPALDVRIEEGIDRVASRALEVLAEAGDDQVVSLAYAALDAPGAWLCTAGAWALARAGNPVGEADVGNFVK